MEEGALAHSLASARVRGVIVRLDTARLTITTTRPPATDLGHLLHKHPERLRAFALPNTPSS
ncbi:MAG: hypothetical protein ACYCST_21200 [Acidimicrobiales bacterium]